MIKNEALPVKLSTWRSFLLLSLLVLGLISPAPPAASNKQTGCFSY